MRKTLPIGCKIRVKDTIPLHAGKIGVIVSPKTVPTNGRGVPILPGHYKPFDRKRDSFVLFDNGEIDSVFDKCLEKIL